LHHGTYIGVYPLTPGHETVGENDEAVTRSRPGQQVTVNPNIYCGECAYCLAGQVGRRANTEGWGFIGQASSPSTPLLIMGRSSRWTRDPASDPAAHKVIIEMIRS
jgi:threonine dehydrogenase-like Zn-dependent dehydrogenase